MKAINLSMLANVLQAYLNCKASGNDEWLEKHEARINEMCNGLPHGSGFDSGVTFDTDESTSTRLIFRTSFHHMDENGYYCGWTDHDVRVTPAFGGFNLYISGRDYRGIKDYMYQVFNEAFYIGETYEKPALPQPINDNNGNS